MTIESSPAEMLPATDTRDTERPAAPKAKSTRSAKLGRKVASKSRKAGASRSKGRTKKSKARTAPKKDSTPKRKGSGRAKPSESKGVRTKTRSGKKGPRGGKPGNGTQRTTRAGTKFHIMSVHVPLPILVKLDKKIAQLAKAGKPGASRSGFALMAIQSRI